MSKKIFAILMSFVMLAVCVVPALAAEGDDEIYGSYDHVFIIGVDGAGQFFNTADTPEFDRIFANGAVNYKARAETETTSAQNWGAILCGVSYVTHGFSNTSLDTVTRDTGSPYQSIFSLARSADPDAELASFVHWDPINYGLIETDINVTKYNTGDDGLLTDAICDYFNTGNAPELFFVQFDSIDGAGHSYGCNSEEYLTQINIVDGYVGRVYDAIEQNGLMDNSLFIVVADHGHTTLGGHGGLTLNESYVTVAVAGKNVVDGGKLDSSTRNRDVSAIALYALGIERPDHMTSRVPADLFVGVEGEERGKGEGVLVYIKKLIERMINMIKEAFTGLFD